VQQSSAGVSLKSAVFTLLPAQQRQQQTLDCFPGNLPLYDKIALMLVRLYTLLALFMALVWTPIIALVALYKPAPANALLTVVYQSPYPVITPDNVDDLTPVAILSRGGRGNFENALYQPAWSPDGRYLAAMDTGAEGDTPKGIFLFDMTDLHRPPRLLEHSGILVGYAFSPDSQWIATITHPGYVGGKMIVWDVESGQKQFEFDSANVYDIRFSPDRTRMTSETDALLRVWDTQSLQEIISLSNRCFNFDPTMTIAALADCYYTPSVLSLFDTASGQQVFVGEQEDTVQATDISPDLRLVATGDNRGAIKIWGLASGTSDITLSSGEDYILDAPRVEFSPDGTRLASWTTTGGAVRLWAVESGSLIAALTGHTIPGYDSAGTDFGVMFSLDGQVLASFWPDGLTEDRNLRLWDAATGVLLRTLPDEYSPAFSPDGTMVATDSADGTIKIWAVPSNFDL
jgi:WD40 repeat protein